LLGAGFVAVAFFGATDFLAGAVFLTADFSGVLLIPPTALFFTTAFATIFFLETGDIILLTPLGSATLENSRQLHVYSVQWLGGL
jgi:hypothetical protein